MQLFTCPFGGPHDMNSAARQVAILCRMPASGSWTSIAMPTQAWTGTPGPYYDAAVCAQGTNGWPGTVIVQDTVTIAGSTKWTWTFTSPVSVSEGERYFVVIKPNPSWTTSNWVRLQISTNGVGEPTLFSFDSGATWRLSAEGALNGYAASFVISGQTHTRQTFGFGTNTGNAGNIYGVRKYGLAWTPVTNVFVESVSFHSTFVAGTPPATRTAVYNGQTLVAVSSVCHAAAAAFTNVTYDLFVTLEAGTTYVIAMEAVNGGGDASNAYGIRARTAPSNLELATSTATSMGPMGLASSATDPISWSYDYTKIPDMSLDVWAIPSGGSQGTRRPNFGGGFDL